MTQIVIDVPENKAIEYKQIFKMFVTSYSTSELKEINNISIDLQKHNLDNLSNENLKNYKKSFDVEESSLINI